MKLCLVLIPLLLFSSGSQAQVTVTSISISPSSVPGYSVPQPTMTINVSGSLPNYIYTPVQPQNGIRCAFCASWELINSTTITPDVLPYTVSSSVTYTFTGSPGNATATLTVTPLIMTLSGAGSALSGGTWNGTLTFNASLYGWVNAGVSCDTSHIGGQGPAYLNGLQPAQTYPLSLPIAYVAKDEIAHCYVSFVASDGGTVQSNTIPILLKPAPTQNCSLDATPTDDCPPADVAPETSVGCDDRGPADVSTTPTCGQPISLTTGNTYIVQRDVRIPGLGGGLSLTRFWNSLWPSTQSASAVGLFGRNWRSTYEERVFWASDGTLKYSRADGSFWSFKLIHQSNTTLTVVAPGSEVATITSGSTYWTLSLQNGEQRHFDNASGMLTAIIDRNGNTTLLSYDGLNRLTSVADPVGHHLTFAYEGSSAQVSGVSSDVGLSASYSYDAQGRLQQVTKPDLSTINFEYDANSFITSVKDQQGKIMEAHTYDSRGRGLTSSRANGVESVTVSYPQ